MKVSLGFLVLNFSLLVVSSYLIRDARDQDLRDVISDPRAPGGSQRESTGNDITDAQHEGEPRDPASRGEGASGAYFNKHPEVLEVVTQDSVALGASHDIVTDVLSTFKSFKNPKKLARDWSKETFTKAIKELGVYNVEGLKVLKLKKDEISELKTLANRTKTVRAVHRRVRKGKPLRDELSPNKRTSGTYDLCAEYVDAIYVLAHESSQLAYQIESVRCEGSCTSTTFNLELGSCNLATKTTIVYCIDIDGNFVPKTIEPGCACECLNYYQ